MQLRIHLQAQCRPERHCQQARSALRVGFPDEGDCFKLGAAEKYCNSLERACAAVSASHDGVQPV